MTLQTTIETSPTSTNSENMNVFDIVLRIYDEEINICSLLNRISQTEMDAEESIHDLSKIDVDKEDEIKEATAKKLTAEYEEQKQQQQNEENKKNKIKKRKADVEADTGNDAKDDGDDSDNDSNGGEVRGCCKIITRGKRKGQRCGETDWSVVMNMNFFEDNERTLPYRCTKHPYSEAEKRQQQRTLADRNHLVAEKMTAANNERLVAYQRYAEATSKLIREEHMKQINVYKEKIKERENKITKYLEQLKLMLPPDLMSTYLSHQQRIRTEGNEKIEQLKMKRKERQQKQWSEEVEKNQRRAELTKQQRKEFDREERRRTIVELEGRIDKREQEKIIHRHDSAQKYFARQHFPNLHIVL